MRSLALIVLSATVGALISIVVEMRTGTIPDYVWSRAEGFFLIITCALLLGVVLASAVLVDKAPGRIGNFARLWFKVKERELRRRAGEPPEDHR